MTHPSNFNAFMEAIRQRDQALADLAAAVARGDSASAIITEWQRAFAAVRVAGDMDPMLSPARVAEAVGAARAELRQLREAPVPAESPRLRQVAKEFLGMYEAAGSPGDFRYPIDGRMFDHLREALEAPAPPQPAPVATDADGGVTKALSKASRRIHAQQDVINHLLEKQGGLRHRIEQLQKFVAKLKSAAKEPSVALDTTRGDDGALRTELHTEPAASEKSESFAADTSIAEWQGRCETYLAARMPQGNLEVAQLFKDALTLIQRAAAPPQPVPVATDAEVDDELDLALAAVQNSTLAIERATKGSANMVAACKASKKATDAVFALFRQRTAPVPPSSGNQRAAEALTSLRNELFNSVATLKSQGVIYGSDLAARIERRIDALQAEQPTATVPQPQKPEATRAVLERLRGIWQQTHDDTFSNRCHEEQDLCERTRSWCMDIIGTIDAELAKLDKPAPLQADAAGTAVLQRYLDGYNAKDTTYSEWVHTVAELARAELARRQAIER